MTNYVIRQGVFFLCKKCPDKPFSLENYTIKDRPNSSLVSFSSHEVASDWLKALNSPHNRIEKVEVISEQPVGGRKFYVLRDRDGNYLARNQSNVTRCVMEALYFYHKSPADMQAQGHDGCFEVVELNLEVDGQQQSFVYRNKNSNLFVLDEDGILYTTRMKDAKVYKERNEFLDNDPTLEAVSV